MGERFLDGAKPKMTDTSEDPNPTPLIGPTGEVNTGLPVTFVIIMTLAGLIAFALTGFFGYSDHGATVATSSFYESEQTRSLFHAAWPVYLWICVIALAFEWLVFREPRFLFVRLAFMACTCLGIALVAIAYVDPQLLESVAKTSADMLNASSSRSLTGAFINFGVLAIYAFTTIPHWFRSLDPTLLQPSQSQSTRTSVGVFKRRKRYLAKYPAKREEMIASDFITAALLALALAVLFKANVASSIVGGLRVVTHQPDTTQGINACVVSWPFGACTPSGERPPRSPSSTSRSRRLAV